MPGPGLSHTRATLATGNDVFEAVLTIDASTSSLIGRPANVDPSFEDVTLDDVLNATAPTTDLEIVDCDGMPQCTPPTLVTDCCYTTGGSYLVSYRQTIAAVYSLSVTLNDTSIRDMPSTLTISPDVPAATHTYVYGGGTRQSISGDDTNFTVVTVDAYSNRRTVGAEGAQFTVSGQVRGPRYIPNLPSVDNEDGSYLFSYNLDLVGIYSIVLQLGLEPFAFSPLTPVSIIPGNTHPGSCVAMGPGLSEAEVGQTMGFDIQPRDMYGNPKFDEDDDFSGWMYHPASGTNVSLPNAGTTPPVDSNGDPSNGIWCVEADSLCYGQYRVLRPAAQWEIYVFLSITDRRNVKHPKEPIFDSPFELYMMEAPINPAFCTADGAGVQSFDVGSSSLVTVTSRDAFENAVSYSAETAVEFEVVVTGPVAMCSGTATDTNVVCSTAFAAASGTTATYCPDGCDYVPEVIPSEALVNPLESLRNGQYQLTWSSLVSGTYRMAITLDDIHIKDSPFNIPIGAGSTSLEHSEYVGDGLTATVAGAVTTYDVMTKDMYGNARSEAVAEAFNAEVMIVVNGGASFSTISATVVDNNDGSLTVTYDRTLTVVGVHNQYMTLGSTQAHQETIEISPAELDPATSLADGPGLLGSFAGTSASFEILPKDEFGNLVPDKAGDFVTSWEFGTGHAEFGEAVTAAFLDVPCHDMMSDEARAITCPSSVTGNAQGPTEYCW